MTREEAIAVLKAFMENPLFSDAHKQAFNIAIHDIKAYQDWNINNLILVNKDNYESIEQEPTTKNNLGVDAISRKQAIEEADKLCLETGYDNEKVIEMLNDLPSVTPQEPRKGHWIWCVGSHKCSNCEEYTCFSHKELLRYCPNCGAKMESEEYGMSKCRYDLSTDCYNRDCLSCVLDKIRAEIAEYGSIMVAYAITKETKTDKGIEKLVSDVLKQAKEQVLDIIDKYKAEVEPQESEDKE